MRYYVVTYDNSSYNEKPNESGEYEGQIWTVSSDPNEPGWNTDGGYSGYGLTKQRAQFLCDAANEKLEREGKLDAQPS